MVFGLPALAGATIFAMAVAETNPVLERILEHKAQKTLSTDPEVLVTFPAGGVDFEWDAEHTKEDFKAAGNYVKEHNAVAGIKISPNSKPSSTTVYLTVPRWVGGVASTLNKITINTEDGMVTAPKLTPWPSWEWNAQHTETGNCDTLQNVQSMEIDAEGFMWVIDVGRLRQFTADVDNTCPPKLIVFDTQTGKQVGETFVFPEDVVSRTESFLNDIVVDSRRNRAYISDTATNGGHIYLYDRTERTAYRWSDSSMDADMTTDWTIGGVHYDDPLWKGAPEDGIALTPDGNNLIYSPLTAPHFYWVETVQLWERTTGSIVDTTMKIDGEWAFTLEGPYPKSAPSDGMTFGCDGTLFYGGITDATVYADYHYADLGAHESLFAHNDTTMNWVDTFAWGPDGALWYTANHLDVLFGNGVGAAGEINVFRAPPSKYVRGSYVHGFCGYGA